MVGMMEVVGVVLGVMVTSDAPMLSSLISVSTSISIPTSTSISTSTPPSTAPPVDDGACEGRVACAAREHITITYLLFTSAAPLAAPLATPSGCGGRGGGTIALPGLARRLLLRAVREWAAAAVCACAAACAAASRSSATAPEYKRALLDT